jgi:hypothetical protein
MREKILQMVDAYWKFDYFQHPMSSWHDKQDLLKALGELLQPPPSTRLERYGLKVGYKDENGKAQEVIINAEDCDEAYNIFKKQFGDIRVEYID